MKILKKEKETVEFESIEQGKPFYYGSNKTLCMKVSTITEDNCHANAVKLANGVLIRLYDSEVVVPACVHIEDD
jgi:hypothetical protein